MSEPSSLFVERHLRAGIFSLAGFVLFYSALAIVDVALMVRAVRQGPPVEDAPPGRHPFAPQRPRVA